MQVLVVLASPGLARALGEARAALERERAELARLTAGMRAEDLAIAASNVSRAKSQLALTTLDVAREERLGAARTATGSPILGHGAALRRAVRSLRAIEPAMLEGAIRDAARATWIDSAALRQHGHAGARSRSR